MTPNERRAIVTALLNEFGEDYITLSRIVRVIVASGTTRSDVLADFLSKARTQQQFIDAGLSIDWWVGEIDRLSQ